MDSQLKVLRLKCVVDTQASVWRQHKPCLTSARALLSSWCIPELTKSQTVNLVALLGGFKPYRVSLSSCGKVRVISVAFACSALLYCLCLVLISKSDTALQGLCGETDAIICKYL